MSSQQEELFPKSNKRASHIRNLAFWLKPKPFEPGTVVLITGAASGIAKQISRIYAQRGAKLVICDYNEKGLAETVDECRFIRQKTFPDDKTSQPGQDHLLTDHSSVIGIKTDVTKEEDCAAFINLAIEKFKRIDILLLCAGIGAHNEFSKTKDLSIYRKCIDVNYYGYLYCTYYAYPHLIASGGVLTAVTSMSGDIGLPLRTAYCASKFAVTGFLESLRAEMESSGQKTFHISIVCPPSTNTNLRNNSLTTDPHLKEVGKQGETKSMSVEDCASCIVDATDRRLRKAFFPFSSMAASYIRPFIPDQIDQKIWEKSRL